MPKIAVTIEPTVNLLVRSYYWLDVFSSQPVTVNEAVVVFKAIRINLTRILQIYVAALVEAAQEEICVLLFIPAKFPLSPVATSSTCS
jgi:hypothetical protein